MPGQVVNHEIEHTVENFDNLEVVAWVQNIATKEVYNSCTAATFTTFSKKSNWAEITTNLLDNTFVNIDSYKIEGDTLIEGKSYSKLLLNNNFFSALRETEDNKIYGYFPFLDPKRELLIYDFDWYPGKTLYFQPEYMDEPVVQVVLGDIIDSIQLLDGKYYQYVDTGNLRIIRGIGNTGNYPEIDFKNNSLLFVTGSTNYSISNIKIKSLQLLKPDQYELSIDFNLKDTLIVERWLIALVVPKMSSNSKVALNLTRIGGDYPVELPCEVFSLKGTLCRWEVFPKHQVFLINSNEDLENYIYCFDGIYPVIDFENYTMLLVCGIQPSSDIFVLNAFLFKYEPVEYVYRVEILVGLAGMPGVWWSAILIKKIPEDTIVQFDLVKYSYLCTIN